MKSVSARAALALASVVTALAVGCLLLLPATAGRACSRSTPFTFNELFSGELIVRVTAVKYVVAPPAALLAGAPISETPSTIQFRVDEWLGGAYIAEGSTEPPKTIVLNGYLNDKDDFNDSPMPYTFVRSEGRKGNCFANTYNLVGQYLLFLKRGKDFGLKSIGNVFPYTPYWSALGPTNEQIKSGNDPWVWWVKVYLASRKAKQ